MTQQQANILNEFYTRASGKSDSFRYYKNASTLANYLRTWKQLLTYYYRVVYSEDSHFSKAFPEQRVLKDVIECTRQQQRAMEGVVRALDEQEQQGDKELLKHVIRRFCLTLIC